MIVTDEEIKKYYLDNYEIIFINKKIESLTDENADFQKSIIFEGIELFQRCIKNKKQKIKEIYDQNLILYLTDFVERATFFDSLYAFWDKKLTAKEDSEIFSFKNAVHNFYPIFVMEIEGPLKKLLLIIDFVLRIDSGKQLDWSKFQFKYRYIPEVIQSIASSSKNSQHINEIIEGLNPPNHPINITILRNAGAHSNYKVIEENKKQYVEIEDKKGHVKIELNEFLGLYSMTTDLIKLLSIIVHLGLRRIEIK
jgi:hypothetical protein